MITRAKNFLASERAIYFLVALFVLLGALYSVTTPIFEAGDELWHYPHVQWIARGNGLPVQDPTREQLWEQEGGQPPLYYALSAALTFWIDTSDLQARLWRNPYAKIGVPLAFGNKNMVAHTRAENFPWQGTTLAVHLIRLLSVLFSAGTVFLTHKIARDLTADTSSRTTRTLNRMRDDVSPNPSPSQGEGRRGEVLSLVAASFVAFNPMFLFISAAVNNDSLAALLATAAIFLCIRLVTRGVTNVRVFVLGIVVGLAILTKVSNLALGIVAMSALVFCVWRTKKYFDVLRFTFLFLLPIVLLDVWWFARNFVLYGDALAFNVWMEIAGGRAPQTLLGLLNEFQGFRISFWGNFGGVNIIAPEWVYTTLDIFSLLAVIGLLIGLFPRAGDHKGSPLPKLLWIPALHVVVVFIALIRWTLLTYASQGRLMFPAIAAVAVLLTFGLSRLADLLANAMPSFVVRRSSFVKFSLPILLAAFLLLFALAAPFLLIAPAYTQPARVAAEASVPNPVHIKYDAGDAQPELVGFETARFVPVRSELPLKLFWRTDKTIAKDLALYIHVYDARGELIGQWDAFPGNGLFPTRLWQPNEIFVDEYRVPLRGDVASQQIARVEVGLVRVGQSRPLVARDPQGNVITPSIAEFGIFDANKISSAPARFVFGDELDLVDVRFIFERGVTSGPIAPVNASGLVSPLAPNDVIRADYTLRARHDNLKNYTVFAQWVDAQGIVVAQYDSPPRQNAYPTSYWRAGESVSDSFTFTIPSNAAPGMYSLLFGIYGSDDKLRLPVRGETFEHIRANGDHLILAPVELAR